MAAAAAAAAAAAVVAVVGLLDWLWTRLKGGAVLNHRPPINHKAHCVWEFALKVHNVFPA